MVVIMRGPSGSGKSTFAHRLLTAKEPRSDEQLPKLIAEALEYPLGCRYSVSADKFFEVDGEYRFDRNDLGAAHAHCLRLFVELAQEGHNENLIVVDNTNTTVEEIAPYAAVGRAYGHDVHIVEVTAGINDEVDFDDGASECWGRNIHGVPLETVDRQVERLARSRRFARRMGVYHRLFTSGNTKEGSP